MALSGQFQRVRGLAGPDVLDGGVGRPVRDVRGHGDQKFHEGLLAPLSSVPECVSARLESWSARSLGFQSLLDVGAGRRRPCGDLLPEHLEGGDVDLGEGREGLDRVREDVEREVAADRQCGLLQPLTRLGSERIGANQPFAVAQQGDEPLVVGVGARVGGDLGDLREGTVAL